MPSKTIAQRGPADFIVQTKENLGHVVELETEMVHPEFNVQSILARGYWDEVTDTEGAARAEELVGGS